MCPAYANLLNKCFLSSFKVPYYLNFNARRDKKLENIKGKLL